jgi:hypothetical protein
MARASGVNSRPFDQTIAGTGPGIPDDALSPGQELPTAPSDEEVEAAAEALGAPLHGRPGPDGEPRADEG